MRDAASLDIGDWMRFEVGPSVNVRTAGAQGARVKVQSFIGTKIWAAFQVDIVADGIQMTGEPDTVLPLTAIEFGDQERAPWRAYPLAITWSTRCARSTTRPASLEAVLGPCRPGRDHQPRHRLC